MKAGEYLLDTNIVIGLLGEDSELYIASMPKEMPLSQSLSWMNCTLEPMALND